MTRQMKRIESRLNTMPPEKRDYALRHIPYYLAQSDDWDKLFHLIDDGQFLIAKTDRLGGYRELTADIKAFAIRGAVKQSDWLRFLHYALLATNLDGLTDALAEEEVLCVLMESGQGSFALDIAVQVSDPLRRACARAVIVACFPSDKGPVHSNGIPTKEQAS